MTIKTNSPIQNDTGEMLTGINLQLFTEAGAAGADSTTAGAATGGQEQQQQTDPPGTNTNTTTGQTDTGLGKGLLSGDQKTDPATGAQQEGAPEEYTDFTMPEGVQVSPEDLTAFKGLAKELGFPQATAQKLVEFQTKMVQAQTTALQNQFAQTVEGWRNETIQALGQNSQQELAVAKKGFDTYASDGLKQVLSQFGLDNHKEVISLFSNLGKMVKEDTYAEGGKFTKKTDAVDWFPNSKK